MPLYEYRCTQCGYRFEKIQSFGAEPETKCPKCSGALIRPLTVPAFQFKGAGWYVNDYAAKSAPSSESGSESKTGGDSAKAGSEGKPAESKTAESKISESKPAAASASDSGSSKSGSAS